MVIKIVEVKIKCVHCESEEVVKMGYQKNGTPRCGCKDCGKTFQTKYVNNGALLKADRRKGIKIQK